MKKTKKGQAAIEFITTYSWAIMGVLLAIGALSYFDLMNTDRFISERCDTGSQLQCVEALLLDNGQFYLNISNNYPVNIEITSLYTRTKGQDWDEANFGGGTLVNRGETILLQKTISDIDTSRKENIDIIITFKRESASFSYNTTGNAVLKVLPEDII